MKVGDKHVGGLLQFGIRGGMDPMDNEEERIVRAVLVALKEGQRKLYHHVTRACNRAMIPIKVCGCDSAVILYRKPTNDWCVVG